MRQSFRHHQQSKFRAASANNSCHRTGCAHHIYSHNNRHRRVLDCEKQKKNYSKNDETNHYSPMIIKSVCESFRRNRIRI